MIGWETPVISFLLGFAALSLPLFDNSPGGPADTAATNSNLTNIVLVVLTNAVSATPVSTNTVTVVFANAANSPSFPRHSPTNAKSRWRIAVVLFAIAIGASVSAIYKAHIKRVYDPDLVIQFEKEFAEMAEQRGRAAGALLLYSQKNDWAKVSDAGDIEQILDFFDNLGFYLYGDQLSERVLHQSFYHYIAVYYQGSCSYIRERREGAEGEKSTWEHIEYLVDEVFEIEAAKQGCSPQALKLSPNKYKKYIMEEFEEGDEDYTTKFRKDHPDLFAVETNDG